MSRDQFASYGGFFLGVIGAIPALYFIFNQQWVVALLTVGIVVALVFVFIALGRLTSPPFTVMETEKTLRFESKNSALARHIDVRTIRANHKGQTEYWFKELGRPAALGNILIDGETPYSQREEMGALRVSKRFSHELGQGDIFESTLTLDISGAFPDSHEAYVYKVIDDTKQVTLRVRFHPDKPFIEAKPYRGYGSGTYEPLKTTEPRMGRLGLRGYRFTESKDKTELELEVKNPQRGQQYRIEWEW